MRKIYLIASVLATFSHGFQIVPSRSLHSPLSYRRTERHFFNFGQKPQPKQAEPEPSKITTPEEEPDAVEKLFTFFFGKPEEEPFGLKRFGRERFPEQYPATVDDFDVASVEADDKEMAALRPLLKNTNLEERAVYLTYSANNNGWSAEAFHNAVDRKGGALVVCTTTSGQVCGGYNPKGWVGYGEARGSIAAFLFVRNKDGTFTKLRKVGGAGLAQIDNPESGPSFGADSLVIPLNRDNKKLARSKLGSYYERFEDGTNSLFVSQAAVQLRDLKVYHGVYKDGEFIPFSDAEPFALS
jgi:hypothetical protein